MRSKNPKELKTRWMTVPPRLLGARWEHSLTGELEQWRMVITYDDHQEIDHPNFTEGLVTFPKAGW